MYFQAMSFALPAVALEASSCAAKSVHLKPSERSTYLKSCLAQVSSPANVKDAELRRKRALCEQNAKNYKMQGNNRNEYIATCMNENEALAATKGVHNQARAAKKAVKPVPPHTEGEAKMVKSKPKTLRSSKRETMN
jgi:hypothetical protein